MNTASTAPGAGSAPSDSQLLRLATYASVSVALFLIAAKAIAYAQTGAVSVLASLVDSLMDAAASMVNLLAVRYALMPADREHRFGHGKAEALAALGQALLIAGSSVYLAVAALQRLRAPQALEAVDAGLAVMLLSLVTTGGLLLFLRRVIRRTGSPAIRADALHYRGDLLSNVAVLATLLLAKAGWNGVDPILALAIALYLLLSTRSILLQAIDELLDRELPAPERRAIIDTVLAHPQVYGVHDVRTRRSGRLRLVQMHVELDDRLSLREARDIAEEVEAAIHLAHANSDVAIHLDPVGSLSDGHSA